MQNAGDIMLTPEEASEYLKTRWKINHTEGTLRQYRKDGRGPHFHKAAGRYVLYSERQLDVYARTVIGRPIDPRENKRREDMEKAK